MLDVTLLQLLGWQCVGFRTAEVVLLPTNAASSRK